MAGTLTQAARTRSRGSMFTAWLNPLSITCRADMRRATTRTGSLAWLLITSLACSPANGEDSSSGAAAPDPSEQRLEGLDFDDDGQLPRAPVSGGDQLHGQWHEVWGPGGEDRSVHTIDAQHWLRQSAGPGAEVKQTRLHFAHLDAEAGWALLQYDEVESWYPRHWTRIHWLRRGEQLFFCELSPPYARADAAVEAEVRIATDDRTTGCLGFAWSSAARSN